MLVEAVAYRDGRRVASGDVAEMAARSTGPGEFVWVGLHDPTDAEIHEVAAVFDLHALAVEDSMKARQRPKAERYDDWLFVVLRTARYLDEPEKVEFGEIQIHCAPHAIVVLRRGAPVPLDGVRAALEADPETLALGVVGVLHAVVDEVVDTYRGVLAGLEDDVNEVEEAVFSDHPRGEGPRILERLYFLQREIVLFHGALHPLLTAVPVLVDDPLVRSDPRGEAYFRDVSDHVIREASGLQALRDVITAAFGANATRVGLRQNEDMRRISAWVAIAAVPTVIGAIYGMNFEHMPELGWEPSYPVVLAVMVLGCLALYRSFRRSGWL